MPIATTTLLRTTKDSVAFAMSQRLGRSYSNKGDVILNDYSSAF